MTYTKFWDKCIIKNGLIRHKIMWILLHQNIFIFNIYMNFVCIIEQASNINWDFFSSLENNTSK